MINVRSYLKNVKVPIWLVRAMSMIVEVLFTMSKFCTLSNHLNHDMSVSAARKLLTQFRKIPTISNEIGYSFELRKDTVFDISIIVPCYNVQEYIDNCILSLKRQFLDGKFEVIFINDGSTDKTLERIISHNLPDHWRIVNQKNAGRAAAKNVGLKLAQGRYIFFLDADDELPEFSLFRLLDKMQETHADAVAGNIVRMENPRKSYYRLKDASCSNNQNQVSLEFPGMAPGILFRREVWDGVSFPEQFEYEDSCVVFLIAPRIVKFVSISNSVYLYRRNPSGISRSAASYKVLDTVYIGPHLLDEAKVLGIPLERVQEIVLRQYSWFVVERVSKLKSVEILKASFIFCRQDYLSRFGHPLRSYSNKFTEAIDQSFRNGNFSQWVLTSKLWILDEKVHQLL